MNKHDLKSHLTELHKSLIETLKSRISNGVPGKDGELEACPSADLKLAWEILKQNAVPIAHLDEDTENPSEEASILDDLPFTDDEDQDFWG